MLAIVSITHTAPPDAVAVHAAAHRAYLRSLFERRKLVASGPLASGGGGTLLLRAQSEREAREMLRDEPYLAQGVASHDVRMWTPTLGAEQLDAPSPTPLATSPSVAPHALAGRAALVTGASSGIGEATALALAREGAKVVLAARRIERLQALAERIGSHGGEAFPIAVDVAREPQARAAVEGANRHFGRLDIVVNSAGIMLLAPVAEATSDEWRTMVDLNLLGLMHVTQAAVAVMRRGGGGHVVNIASLAGRIANPNASAYAATKFGVVGFSESLRREVYKDQIRVTVIEPGVVATELGDHIENPAMKAGLKERLASTAPLQAEDVAAAVVYAVTQPQHASVNEILLRPTGQER
jgi:NADP-dependent 3-hydroxy acid dehydrogenase YdfG/uncharacterized protein YciI